MLIIVICYLSKSNIIYLYKSKTLRVSLMSTATQGAMAFNIHISACNRGGLYIAVGAKGLR